MSSSERGAGRGRGEESESSGQHVVGGRARVGAEQGLSDTYTAPRQSRLADYGTRDGGAMWRLRDTTDGPAVHRGRGWGTEVPGRQQGASPSSTTSPSANSKCGETTVAEGEHSYRRKGRICHDTVIVSKT